MKALKSSVCSETAIEISWVSSAGRIEDLPLIYYRSQNRASLKDTHDNYSLCLIAISI